MEGYQKRFRYNKSDIWGNWFELVSQKESKRSHWSREKDIREWD